MHAFDEAIALQPLGEGRYEGRSHPAWANMVGPYGGITAATLLNAALSDPRRLGEPLALTVNYAGPVADGSFTIEATPARTNRSSQHWMLVQRQGDAVCTTATAVFALRRDTWSAPEIQMPPVPAAHTLAQSNRNARVKWIVNYDVRFVTGPWPDLHNPVDEPDSCSAHWMRDHPERPLDATSLAALCDLFYARLMRRRPKLVPFGTVSMNCYFHADAAEMAKVGTQHVLGTAQGQRYVGGFFDHVAQVWAPSGELLASTQQVVYFKE